MHYARILLPRALDTLYTYRLPEGFEAAPGDVVRVPLGRQEEYGVIWALSPEPEDMDPDRIRDVLDRAALPPLPEVSRGFVDRAAHYYAAPRGNVLKLVLSVPDALEPPRNRTVYTPGTLGAEPKLTPKQRAVWTEAQADPPRSAPELARAAGCGPDVVKRMAARGWLREKELAPEIPVIRPDPAYNPPDLTPDQQKSARKLVQEIRAERFAVTLLDGVTGAGKTDVYFEAVAACMKAERQALILLPEIALTDAFLSRFESRFGTAPAIWHSHQSPAQRRDLYRGIASGHIRAVIGARSALFLPYPDLGLIVVDEEHEPAYKQEDGVMYHARDMAVLRGHLGECPVLLVSATPSLETVHNVVQKRYGRLTLPHRYGGAALPEVKLIDMRDSSPPRGFFLSPDLISAIRKTFAENQQALLFLNRRGYAPLTLCRACGQRMECPRCTAWLVEHRKNGQLQCHHCGFSTPLPRQCPSCGAKDSLVTCGPGVERIAEEAAATFPEARRVILSSDHTGTEAALHGALEQIRNKGADLIIGTQIIAKGHHFPDLTCVGVVDADLGLSGGDLRAAERSYQVLHQVGGRAGRGESPGTVYLQSYNPHHPVMLALKSGERDSFYAAELQAREAARMPPFTRLAALIVSSTDPQRAAETARALALCAPAASGLAVWGPAPAPLAMLRKRYRYRLLVQAEKHLNVQDSIRAWLSQVKKPHNVQIQIDIDPVSFL